MCPIAYAAAMPQPAAPRRAPRIGITPCLDAAGRLRAGRRTHYVDARIPAAVAEAGGVALLLPAPGEPGALLDAVDALLVPGGDDLPPPAGAAYAPDVRFVPAAEEQLAFDAALLAAAWARALPVLGVCYGMQLLAHEAGGGLHHHLPADLPGAADHRLADPEARHALRVAPGTRLAGILGEAPGPVNSRHHQAVADPGRGLRAAAWSADGVIEALEADGGADAPFLVGVQWHPEDLAGPHRTALFPALVAAAAAWRERAERR